MRSGIYTPGYYAAHEASERDCDGAAREGLLDSRAAYSTPTGAAGAANRPNHQRGDTKMCNAYDQWLAHRKKLAKRQQDQAAFERRRFVLYLLGACVGFMVFGAALNYYLTDIVYRAEGTR